MGPETEILEARNLMSVPPIYNGVVTLSSAQMMDGVGHIVYLTDDAISEHLGIVQAHQTGGYSGPVAVDAERSIADRVDLGSATLQFNQGLAGLLSNGALDTDGATLTVRWSEGGSWYAADTDGFNANITTARGGSPAPTFNPVPTLPANAWQSFQTDPEMAAMLVSLFEHKQE